MSLFVLFADAPYLIVQASFALRDIFGATPFDQVADPTPEEQLLFDRAGDVRSFGVRELGLADTNSYLRYRRIDREALVWVVSGVRSTAWERRLWSYPFVGALPYRGYYRPEEAQAEAERLRSEGYDAIVRRVGAFSFLGIVPDPLYSLSLERSHSSLADLILHEMAHGTLFVSGRGAFNENFATFVGLEGSRRYIAATYGADSEEYREMTARRRDQETARRLVMELHADLVALFEGPLPEGELPDAKEEIYRRFRERLGAEYGSLFSTEGYRWLAETELNNAVVDLFIKYSGDVDAFYELLARSDGSLAAVIRELGERRGAIGRNGMDAVRDLVEVSAADQGGVDG